MRFFLAPLTENLAVMGFLIFYMPKNADLLSNSGEMDTQIKNKLKALYDDMKRQMLTPFVDAMKDKPMPRDDKPELFARIRKQISRED